MKNSWKNLSKNNKEETLKTDEDPQKNDKNAEEEPTKELAGKLLRNGEEHPRETTKNLPPKPTNLPKELAKTTKKIHKLNEKPTESPK
ncbi:hypothetical protein C2G38_2168344 [Gigaspora rosea]|uniref:Uncharacterized protein n=1 Tax=Gigaspora rosea TaxID=44941 RepID=A0A397VRY3_9GLOM|nr:hypothetical protein C2G38_2168344 [Gigaspora rosea]